MNPDALDRGIAGGDPLLQQYLRKLHEGFGNTPWEGMDLNMETYGGELSTMCLWQEDRVSPEELHSLGKLGWLFRLPASPL